MVHVHGLMAQRLAARTAGIPLDRLAAVAVDVGKSQAAVMVCDFTGQVLVPPTDFAMNRRGVTAMVARVEDALPVDVRLIRCGVEAAGHYHRPLTAAGVLPAGWQVVELNPAHVTEQRRISGKRGVKTDAVDLAAIIDLLLAGRGNQIVAPADPAVELTAWVAHRRRRIVVRTATKNQLTGQVDRCFPGLGRVISSVLGTKVGRLVAADFSDPERLARLGVTRFRAYAARRDVRVSTGLAERLVEAARYALPTDGARVARRVLTADLTLLDGLDTQIVEVDALLEALVPVTEYAVLTSVPGWGAVRAAGYAAGLGAFTRLGVTG